MLERFVGAIQRRDGAALQALVRPGNAADTEIAALLARSGGCSLTDGTARVEYSLLLTPNTSSAVVRGTCDGAHPRAVIEEHLALQRLDDRWYLVLGARER
ncbi:MAG TPA: hypothetical protein VJZ76_03545 [Thermoanaerobaculia bacterium]|nr:hypothetical protein [Thermoanaerobaculia bacterium]